MHLVPNEQGSTVAQSIHQRPTHKVQYSTHPQQPNGSSGKDASLSNSTPTSTKPTKRTMTWSTLAALTMQVSLQDWVLIGAMIFGGCCSNVFALEILVKWVPNNALNWNAVDTRVSFLAFFPFLSNYVPCFCTCFVHVSYLQVMLPRVVKFPVYLLYYIALLNFLIFFLSLDLWSLNSPLFLSFVL